MLEGNTIVEQALEVAKTEAQAELIQAEAQLASAAATEHSIEAMGNVETPTSDSVLVAEIEAEKEIAIAEIAATTHEEGCCETCRGIEGRLAILEKEFHDHSTRMQLEMATLKEKREPDVTQVPVQDVKEKKPKEEKPKEEKSKFGRLYLG